MTLIHISFGLMTVAAVVLYIANRRLIKMLKSASHALESTGESLEAARKELSSAYMRIEAQNMHIDSLNRERTNRILSGLNNRERKRWTSVNTNLNTLKEKDYMVTQPQNRKMALSMVCDTVDGVDRIGCRASGIHKGHHIERTAWQPVKDFAKESFGWLETIARGRYKEEVEAITRKSRGT